MRPSASLVAAIPILFATSAYAERVGGTGGGRGRLGTVSGGIATATASERSGGGGGRGNASAEERPRGDQMYRRVWRTCPTDIAPQSNFGTNAPPSTSVGSRCRGRYIAVIDTEGTVVREYQPTPQVTGGTANFDFFVGGQKVFQSDGSLSLMASVDDRWFRLAGSLTRYYEEQMNGSTLTMTMPTLVAGVRIDGGSNTRAFLEGGVAVASTKNDPVADSSITGAMAGVHLEHRFHGKASRALLADAHAMYFESDVKAYSARLGVRLGYLETAFRVLDFNVGPALFGPEVGLRF